MRDELILEHDCNAYCRGDVHAQLTYVALLDPEFSDVVELLAAGYAKQTCRDYGLEFVSLEPAPEAPPKVPDNYLGFAPGRPGRPTPPPESAASLHPYLLRFRHHSDATSFCVAPVGWPR
jgi:hypothetical protein